MSLQSLLPYVTPPVVGAVIGYVTNDIAIRMLFRPLKPWHLFGLRVPLTPGVIPAGRLEFATSIGRMVGTHLVTGEDVARALGKDAFRRELQETVTEKLDQLLDRDLGPVCSLTPPGFERWLRDMAAAVSREVADGFASWVECDSFKVELALCLRDLEERVLPREVARLLSGDRADALREGAGRMVAGLLQSRGVARSVASLVDEKLDDLMASDRPLRELIPADAAEFIGAQVDALMPALLDRVADLLQEPQFRTAVEQKLKDALANNLHSLKGMLGFMAGLINVEKLATIFPGLIPGVIDEIGRWLREEQTCRQIGAVVRRGLDEALDRPLAATVEAMSYQRIATVKRLIRRGALGLVRNPGTAGLLVALAEREVQRVAAVPGQSPLQALLAPDEAERLRNSVAEWLLALLQSPESRAAVERMTTGQIEQWFFHRPVGRLGSRIPADARRDLDGAIYRQVAELLQKEVPPLIDALDVSRMVEEKINTLDILKVEELLLSIMEKHFLYINLFGALLGFVMGSFNVLLMFWSR